MTGDEVIAALDLPATARVDRRVPKTMFLEHGTPTAADRRHVNEGIEHILWVAALKPTTIGVAAHRDDAREYLEIAYAEGDRLFVPVDQADMLIGEVKEGRAEMNEAVTDPAVLQAALARFGCCPSMDTSRLAETLLRKGETMLPSGHRLRMVAFGVSRDDAYRAYTRIPMGHVVTFLQDYLRRHWEVLRHAQFKDPAFGFLATLEKASQKPAWV